MTKWYICPFFNLDPNLSYSTIQSFRVYSNFSKIRFLYESYEKWVFISNGEWSNLAQPNADNKKISKKFFIVIFYTHKISNILEFFIFHRLIYKVRIPKILFCGVNRGRQKKFKNSPILSHSLFLHSRFFIYSTNLCFPSSRGFTYRLRPYWRFFFFFKQKQKKKKKFDIVHKHTGAFYLFLLQKGFGIFLEPF